MKISDNQWYKDWQKERLSPVKRETREEWLAKQEAMRKRRMGIKEDAQ